MFRQDWPQSVIIKLHGPYLWNSTTGSEVEVGLHRVMCQIATGELWDLSWQEEKAAVSRLQNGTLALERIIKVAPKYFILHLFRVSSFKDPQELCILIIRFIKRCSFQLGQLAKHAAEPVFPLLNFKLHIPCKPSNSHCKSPNSSHWERDSTDTTAKISNLDPTANCNVMRFFRW